MTARSQRILVTGAAGFLGSHLCHRLVREGFGGRLTALDDAARGRQASMADAANGITIVDGDVRDQATVARCMEGVDLVFHLAGVADPRACEHDPAYAYAVNVEGTRVVVRAAAGKRLVLLSSAAVYLSGAPSPREEDGPVGAASTYGATKLAAERLCLDAMREGRLEAIIVRNFNTYGGGQSTSFLVPQLVEQGLGYGRIQIASCRPVRDFTYIEDAIAALVSLGLAAIPSGVFNLGSGHGVAVGELALELGRLLDVPVSCMHAPVAGHPHLVAANAKLRAAIGWAPTIDLTAGLTRTIAWFKTRPAGSTSPHTPRRR